MAFTRINKEITTLVLLFVAVILSRLPFINLGYGLDPDAWRVIDVSRTLAETGLYKASRLPGYPLYEYLIALTSAYKSSMYSNFITAIFSAISTCFFALILRTLNIQRYIYPALAFALVPVVYINSVNTMEYMIAFTFVLMSFYYTLKSKYRFAAILLGLAIGFRITSGAMLLPLLIIILTSKTQDKKTKSIEFLSITLLMATIAFIPVFKTYGLNFFTFYDHDSLNIIKAISKFSVGVWGTLGLVGLFVALIASCFYVKRILELPIQIKQVLIALIVSIFLYILAFIRLPHESAYLIPVAAFTLMALTIFLPNPVLLFLYVCLMISPFILTIDPTRFSMLGPIVIDTLSKKKRIDANKEIIFNIQSLPGKHLIIAGSRMPSLQPAFNKLDSHHILIYSIKNDSEKQAYKDQGFTIIHLDEI